MSNPTAITLKNIGYTELEVDESRITRDVRGRVTVRVENEEVLYAADLIADATGGEPPSIDEPCSMASVAFVYQSPEIKGMLTRLVTCLVPDAPEDNEETLKAKAHAYFEQHKEFGPKLKGMSLLLWQVSRVAEREQ